MNFFKSINWKKFFKYESFSFLILLAIYLGSPNVYPENFYVVILIPLVFGLMMIVSSHLYYIINK